VGKGKRRGWWGGAGRQWPKARFGCGKKNKKDELVLELGYIREKRDFQKNKPFLIFRALKTWLNSNEI
jgi:hypothetical protein